MSVRELRRHTKHCHEGFRGFEELGGIDPATPIDVLVGPLHLIEERHRR